MEQILAALIISCSNLGTGMSGYVIQAKKDCTQRVIQCVVSNRLKNTNLYVTANACGQEIYK